MMRDALERIARHDIGGCDDGCAGRMAAIARDALADPAPVGLTEDERRWFRECQQDYEGLPAHEDLARALAIIDRLSAAPRAEPCSGDYGCFVVEHIEGCYAIDESPFGRACRIAALTAKLRRLSGSEEQP